MFQSLWLPAASVVAGISIPRLVSVVPVFRRIASATPAQNAWPAASSCCQSETVQGDGQEAGTHAPSTALGGLL